MGRRRRQRESPGSAAAPRGRHAEVDERVSSPSPTGLLTAVVSVLVAARCFLPTESAALGETLWIVQFWLIAGVFWLWLAARRGRARRRLDGLDWGLGLLVGGHVISALVVLATDGDRRAALNMLWEWVGIGVSAMMIREVVSEPTGRARLLSVMVIAAITLSGLGLWQHFAWYPRISTLLREYEQLTQTAPTDPADATDRARRLRDLRRELGPMTRTDDPAATQLMRARIAASTEPIGRFALANSFASLLLIGLILGIGSLFPWGTTHWRSWAGLILMFPLAYCFWLTKSRTAWVGLITGLLAWAAMAGFRQRRSPGLRHIVTCFVILLVALPLVASLSGGLDREVITEAPKSMQYRLEYWTATGNVIRDHPLLGVGPGNFRQAYLRHKLPGSSEEVLDAHNLFLDVWANGGVIALAGLLTLLAVMARSVSRHQPQTDGPPEGTELQSLAGMFLWRCFIGVSALAIAAFTELMNIGGFSDGGLWLLLGWCGVSLLWPPSGTCGKIGPCLAAAIALSVHLLGAGGIAMPAILQTLVIAAACVMSESGLRQRPIADRPPTPEPVPWRAMSGAGLCFLLAVACAFSAALPVLKARTQIQLGRAYMTEGKDLAQAMRSFRAAAEDDPLAAEPWRELAVALMSDWVRLAGTDDEVFTSAIAAQREAIQRNPRSAREWQLLGEMWCQRHEVTQGRVAAAEARAAFQQAAERYPNLATLQVQWAQAAAAVGKSQEARQAADRALRLDDLNRQQGHVDKWLAESDREWATSLAE